MPEGTTTGTHAVSIRGKPGSAVPIHRSWLPTLTHCPPPQGCGVPGCGAVSGVWVAAWAAGDQPSVPPSTPRRPAPASAASAARPRRRGRAPQGCVDPIFDFAAVCMLSLPPRSGIGLMAPRRTPEN